LLDQLTDQLFSDLINYKPLIFNKIKIFNHLMKPIYTLLFLLLFAQNTFANDDRIQQNLLLLSENNLMEFEKTWKSELKKVKNYKNRIAILNTASTVYFDLRNIEMMLEINTALKDEALKHGDNSDIASAYLSSAKNLSVIQFFKEAETDILIAEKYLSKIKDNEEYPRLITSLYHLLAFDYFQQTEYEKSISNFKKAVELSELITKNKEDYQIRIYNDLGYTYFINKEYENSENTYKKGIDIQNKTTDIISVNVIKGNLGILNYQKGNNELALKYLNEAVPVLEKNKIVIELIQSYYALGNVYNLLGDKEKSIKYFDKERDLYIKLDQSTKDGVRLFLDQIEEAYQQNLRKQNQIYFTVGSITLILIGSGAFFILKKMHKKKKKVQENKREISDEILQDIIQKLNDFEKNKEFLKPHLTLNDLASDFNINSAYLSKIINQQKAQNFNSYINELKINYITEKIKMNPSFRKYKIAVLAEEAGFISHSTFTKSFKQLKGITPSEYIEKVEQALEND